MRNSNRINVLRTVVLLLSATLINSCAIRKKQHSLSETEQSNRISNESTDNSKKISAGSQKNKSGFIKDWLLGGPFPNTLTSKGEREGFSFDFLKEYGGEEEIIPKNGMKCKLPDNLSKDHSRDITWARYLSPSNVITFKKLFPSSDNSVVYAYCEINSLEDFHGAISVGSDDGIKIWLNSKLIHENKAKRGVMKDEDIIPAHFLKGKNRILIKIDNLQGGFGFCMRAATTPQVLEMIAPEEKRLQPESRFFSKKIKISNQRYRWLTKSRKGEVSPRTYTVKQGIMTQPSGYNRYAKFIKMKGLAKLDFLEIRCFLSKIYNNKGELTGITEINKALAKAREAGVKQVELSVILEHGIGEYYKKRFRKIPVMLMVDQSAVPSGLFPGDNYKKGNSECFSYWDMQNRNFMFSLVNDTVSYYNKSPFSDFIFAWHFRFPSSCDAGYPICDGLYDYSRPAEKAFRNFLKTEKGLTLQEVSSRYGSKYKNWNSVSLPLPRIKSVNTDPAWLDFQEFRIWTLLQNQKEICKIIRKKDRKREIIAWFTTSLKAAGRDGVLIDADLQLSKEFPNLLISHTSVDFFNIEGEVFGSLARENKIPVNIEPVHCTMNSYLRTFFNCMRFPVKQINWLFWIDFLPSTRPWITWVLERGDILDELYQADLIVSPVANMYSYSNLHCKIPAGFWENSSGHENKKAWFRALSASGYDLPWLTDYSTNNPWKDKKTIICGENQILRPQAIEKLINFCKEGGKLIIIGETGSYNMLTGKKDWPLLTQLGVDKKTIIEQKTDQTVHAVGTFLPNTSKWQSSTGIALTKLPNNLNAEVIALTENGTIKAALWKCGKGKVLFWGDNYNSILKDEETTIPALNNIGKKIIQWSGAFRPVIFSEIGVCTFVKKKKDTLYIGLINAKDEMVEGNIKIMTLNPNITYSVKELLFNETQELIISGKELMSKGLKASFGFQWEMKLLKITPHK